MASFESSTSSSSSSSSLKAEVSVIGSDESDDLLWEQLTRLLLTNSMPALHELRDITNLLVNNILQNASESSAELDGKYLRVKATNPSLQKKLFSKAGGEEFVKLLGFEPEVTNNASVVGGERWFVHRELSDHDMSLQEREEVLQSLQHCMQWLDQVLASFQSTDAQQPSSTAVVANAAAAIAPCLIQCELPTGKKILGGFFLHDDLLAIRRFAASFFTPTQ